MGEIAEMMLDGTMDCETGEWNFNGEDGPGWPMTGAEAAEYRRLMGGGRRKGPRDPDSPRVAPVYRLTKSWRKKLERFGEVRANDAYHWQIRKDGKVVADWWPHKGKWRIGKHTTHGAEGSFLGALTRSAEARARNASAQDTSHASDKVPGKHSK